MDVTIDLGKQTRISDVEIGFMQMSRPGVNLPSNVKVMLSGDGENFDEVYSQDELQEKTERPLYRAHKWKGHKKARYVRVVAAGSTFGGYVMCDEIVVR